MFFDTPEMNELFGPLIESGKYPSRKDFGKDFKNGCAHWWFPKNIIQGSYKDDQLLILDVEFGFACSLACAHCYRENDTRGKREKGKEEALSLEEWKSFVDQMVDAGVKAVKIVGQGEPLENRDWMKAFKYLDKSGIKAVIFMAAHPLANENKEKCFKIHGMYPDEIIDLFYIGGHTVFIRGESFRPSVMDGIVKKGGYTQKRNEVLVKLIKRGFTRETPTRLGLEVGVSIITFPDLLDLDKLKNYLNIYLDMVISMPCATYLPPEAEGSLDISLEQKRELYEAIYQQNVKFGIPSDGASPFIGGLRCSQLGNGMYVNVQGNVFACPGSFKKLGNIRQQKLKDIWKTHAVRKKHQEGTYFCPPREGDEGMIITPSELPKNVEQKLGVPKHNFME